LERYLEAGHPKVPHFREGDVTGAGGFAEAGRENSFAVRMHSTTNIENQGNKPDVVGVCKPTIFADFLIPGGL
jgi:hypothetical protein